MDDSPRSPASATATRETSSNGGGDDNGRHGGAATRVRRLGRGISTLMAPPPEAPPGASPASSPSPGTAGAVLADDPAAPSATSQCQHEAPLSTKPAVSFAGSAGRADKSVALLAGYDERLASLAERLDATCRLLEAARDGEVGRARRSLGIAWSVAAALALLLTIALWWSAATTAGQRDALAQAQTRVADAEQRVDGLHESMTRMQSELDQTRAALSKANQAIDRLMVRVD